MRFCSAKALALTGSLSEIPFSLLAAHPFMGKTSAPRGETDTGFSHSKHTGACVNEAIKEESGAGSHTHPARSRLQSARSLKTHWQQGRKRPWARCQQVGKELLAQKQTEAIQRCESNRADFCQDIFEELQTLASGRVLSPPPLNASPVPATSRTQRCPSPGAVLLLASVPHLTTLSASLVSESPAARSSLAQLLPLQTKQDDK